MDPTPLAPRDDFPPADPLTQLGTYKANQGFHSNKAPRSKGFIIVSITSSLFCHPHKDSRFLIFEEMQPPHSSDTSVTEAQKISDTGYAQITYCYTRVMFHGSS
jgi:hypothetical protein